MKAEDIMQPADADIHVDHNLCEAQARFDRFGRDRLLVLDADEVVGTLHRSELPEDRNEWAHLTVQEIMTAAPLPTCAVGDSAGRVRSQLESASFVLVIDAEREVVGIVERDSVPPAPSPSRHGGESPDPTGGRATTDGEGRLHVYSGKPHVRRLREPG